MVNDARAQAKTWLTTYIVAASITDLNGDNATLQHQYSGDDAPLEQIFFGTKNVDLLIIYHKPRSRPLIQHDRDVYGYEESVPIELVAINKTSINAELLIWKAEAEIRRIGETNFLGSSGTLSFEVTKESTQRIGATMIYSVTYNLRYTRNTV